MVEVEDGAEKETQKELGKRIYELAEQLRLEALKNLGLEELPKEVWAAVKLSSANTREGRSVVVNLDDHYQLSTAENVTREVSVYETTNGWQFESGRYFQPDGAMWRVSDSSQGAPWIESSLSTASLFGMVDRLEFLSQNNYIVEAKLSTYHHTHELVGS